MERVAFPFSGEVTTSGAAVSEVSAVSFVVSLSDVSEVTGTSVSTELSEDSLVSIEDVVCEAVVADSSFDSDFPAHAETIRKTAAMHPAKNRFIKFPPNTAISGATSPHWA